MAESNQRKVIDPIVIDEEDPFAELTRIMGFDPRVSALAQAKENQAKANLAASLKSDQPAGQPTAPKVAGSQLRAPEPELPEASGEDFGIDLEKELLGDLADFDQQLDEEPAAPPYLRYAEQIEAPAAETRARPAEPIEAEPVEANAAKCEPVEAAIVEAEPLDVELVEAGRFEAEPVAANAQAASPSAESFDIGVEDEFENVFAEAFDADMGAVDHAFESDETVEPEPVLEIDTASSRPSVEADERQAGASAQDHGEEFGLDDLNLQGASFDHELRAVPAAPAEPAPVPENEGTHYNVAARVNEGDTAASADDRLISDFDLDDLDLQNPSRDDELAEIAALRAEAPLVEPPAATAADPLVDVDMDFAAAFDREFASDIEQTTDSRAGEAPMVAAAAAKAPVTSKPITERTVAPNGDQFATDDDDFEISLEEELGALLAEQPAAIEPAIAASTPGRFSSGSRWDGLSPDDKGRPIATDSRQDAAAAQYRRSFANPSLVARHANFQTPPVSPPYSPTLPTPASYSQLPTPASYSQTPPAPASVPAVDDLDDLLDAMESGGMEDGGMESEAYADGYSPAEPGPSPVVPHGQANYAFEPSLPVPDGGTMRAADEIAASQAAPAAAGHTEEAPSDVEDGAVPDIDTIDVPEAAIAVADDLDIPEIVFEEEQPQSAAYDDIDADLSGGFSETVVSEEPMNQTVRGIARPAERMDSDADFETLFHPATGKAGRTGSEAGFQPAVVDYRYNVQSRDYDDDDLDLDLDLSDETVTSAEDRFVDFDFNKDVEPEIAPNLAARERAPAPRRRGLLIASIVGGVAVLGGVGALALSFGNGGGAGMPALVKADNSPVKVKPENPGGASVPNQDNRVYDAAKGTATTGKPEQRKLVTTSEEPMDVTSVAHADPLPGVNTAENIIPKAEDRIDPAVDAAQDTRTTEGIVVAPRKVKTMVVRSDGTLVAREEPAANDPAGATVAAAPAAKLPAVSANEETGALASEDQPPAAKAVPVKTIPTKKVAVAGDQPANAPAVSALPPAKPVVQAAETKPEEKMSAETKPTEVKAEEVASANVEPTAIAVGAWSVQIASQPSAESAKSTYQDLAKRYGNVIGGHGVNIVKADVAGKGTYWRVRVPAKSREEAISLCNDYKSAGGNCFVSK